MPPRRTKSVDRVLLQLWSADPEPLYGLDLMRATGMSSGALYPLLSRLEAAGWIQDEWEALDPSVAGRPRRRYYRLSETGRSKAEEAYAELAEVAGLRRGATETPSPGGPS